VRNYNVSLGEKHCIVVYVYIGLEEKEDLNIHYKFKDEDLGLHLFYINQTYHWGFRTRVFLVRHCSFVPFIGKIVICSILMYTTKIGISNYLQSVIGIFIKMDHADTKQNTINHLPKPFHSIRKCYK